MKKPLLMAAAVLGLGAATLAPVTMAAAKGHASAPYVIGVPLPETGSSAAMGTDMWHAMQLAARALNAHGGVDGHKVQLIEADSACDPQASVNAANLLVSKNVQAVVGTYCSGAALPAEPIYKRAGIPFVLPSANASSLTEQGDNAVFMVNANGQDQANTAARFFTKIEHAKRIMLVDDQSAYATNLAQLTATAIAKDGGKVIGTEAVPPTQQNFASLANTLKADKIDLVYWTGYYAQGGLLIKQLRELGYKGVITVGDGSVDNILISTAGAQYAQGVFATMTPMPPFLKGPKATAFYQAFKKAWHTAPGPYSALTYDALMTLAAAARMAHSIVPAKVTAALHKVHYMGITGPIAFTKTGNRVNGKFLVLMVNHGKFTLAPHQP